MEFSFPTRIRAGTAQLAEGLGYRTDDLRINTLNYQQIKTEMPTLHNTTNPGFDFRLEQEIVLFST
jgi:hypothetical protein